MTIQQTFLENEVKKETEARARLNSEYSMLSRVLEEAENDLAVAAVEKKKILNTVTELQRRGDVILTETREFEREAREASTVQLTLTKGAPPGVGLAAIVVAVCVGGGVGWLLSGCGLRKTVLSFFFSFPFFFFSPLFSPITTFTFAVVRPPSPVMARRQADAKGNQEAAQGN